MVRHELDVFIPWGSFYERLILDTHRQWTAASVSTASTGLVPIVTVASDNLVRGVDPGLLVMTPLTGGYFNLLRGGEVCCCVFVEIVLLKLFVVLLSYFDFMPIFFIDFSVGWFDIDSFFF